MLDRQIQFLHVVAEDSCKIVADSFLQIPCCIMKCRVLEVTLSEVRRCKITDFMLECSFVEICVSPQFSLEKETVF